MRYLILILIFAFVGCKEEKPTENQIVNQNEKVLEVTHRLYKGECLGYCDTKLIIDSTEIRFIKKGWNVDEEGDWKTLPTIDSTYSITQEQWNNITSLINMDDIMKLDSVYYTNKGEVITEAEYEIKITTDQRKKRITFPTNKKLMEIEALNKYLQNFREK